MKAYFFKGLFLLTMLPSCIHKTKEQQKMEYVRNKNNKITQSIDIGKINITSRLLIHNYRKDYDMPDKNMVYFNVKIYAKRADVVSKEKNNYLDFDIQRDFSLMFDGDSLTPGICQRIYNGIANSYEYVLGFHRQNVAINKKDFTLIYSDKIFGVGSVAFVYNQNDLSKISSL